MNGMNGYELAVLVTQYVIQRMERLEGAVSLSVCAHKFE